MYLILSSTGAIPTRLDCSFGRASVIGLVVHQEGGQIMSAVQYLSGKLLVDLTLALAVAVSPFCCDLAAAQEQADSAVLDEILVTARKRQESLQDVPMSVQAYSGDTIEIERLNNVEYMIGRVPNLSLSSNLLSPGSDFLNIVIRGIGAQSAGTPAVGTFVDGAFVPALSFDIGFLDVERVEILKGPQGTLFGRNTEGGALNIVVRRPDEDFRAKAAFTFDEFESLRGQAAMSGPLSSRWFAGLALDVSRTDGYLDNPVVANFAGAIDSGAVVPANDESRWSGRASLRYAPNDEIDVSLAFDRAYRTGLDGYPGVPRGTEDYIVRSDFQIDADYDNYGAALNIDYSFGNVDLTSISAFRNVSSTLPFDFDGSPERGPNFQDLRTEQEIISQELRLAGTIGESIDWILGAYAFSEESETRRLIKFQDLVFGALLVDAQDQSLERSGYAVFTDFVWHITDRFELNAGVRYTEEDVDSSVIIDFTAPLVGLDIDESGVGTINDSDVSGTFSLKYDLTDNVSVYGRFAQGFRAGGFPVAPATVATNIPFTSETTDTIEFGTKGVLFDGRLRYDLSFFNNDIEDQQLTTLVFINNDPNLPVASVDNAGQSRSRGFEANLLAQITDHFELSASYGYTDAEYRTYVDTVGVDRSGERFPFVPERTFSLQAGYNFRLDRDAELGLIAEYRYVGDILSGSGVDIDLQFAVDSYDVLDLAIRYARDNWTAELFADNVTDEFIETRVFNAFFFEAPRPFSIVLPPRRVGVRIAYAF